MESKRDIRVIPANDFTEIDKFFSSFVVLVTFDMIS